MKVYEIKAIEGLEDEIQEALIQNGGGGGAFGTIIQPVLISR